MPWSAILSMLGLAGSSFGNAISSRKQYKRQLALQKQQQSWAERMSSTAHQREVADLRAAGMNPILTATGGSGASTPSSGLNSVQAENVPDFGTIADTLVASENAEANKQNADTSAKAQQSQADVNESQVKLNQANAALANAKAAKELNIGKPFEKGGKLFDALSDADTYRGVSDWVRDTFGGKSSAKSSGAATKKFEPIKLDSNKKYFRFDGAHREIKKPEPRYINGKWYYN